MSKIEPGEYGVTPWRFIYRSRCLGSNRVNGIPKAVSMRVISWFTFVTLSRIAIKVLFCLFLTLFFQLLAFSILIAFSFTTVLCRVFATPFLGFHCHSTWFFRFWFCWQFFSNWLCLFGYECIITYNHVTFSLSFFVFQKLIVRAILQRHFLKEF